MAEPDHIFVKPLPNLANDNEPAAFPFFYITPSEHEKIVRKYYPKERGPVTDIDPIGNSPVIIKKVISHCRYNIVPASHEFDKLLIDAFLGTFFYFFCLEFATSTDLIYLNLLSSEGTFWTLLEKIAPTWMNVSIQMKEHEETDKTFGWVLEM